MHHQLLIATDDRVIALTGTLILGMVGIIGFGVKWIFNKMISEIKQGSTEANTKITEFTNALNNKFKALNYYTKQADKQIAVHAEHLKLLNDDHHELKKKRTNTSNLQFLMAKT